MPEPPSATETMTVAAARELRGARSCLVGVGRPSTAAMLACCAHHLADILPIVGAAGAAAFLNAYKVPMLWLGIAMNLFGIIYLLRKIEQHRAMTCHTPLASRSIAS